MYYKLSELIAKFGGILVGEDLSVSSIAPTDLAEVEQLTFLSDKKYLKDLGNCKASAIILDAEHADKVTIPKIITSNPYYYFSQVSNLFNPRRRLALGISPRASIDTSVVIANNPAIAANVVIGKNCRIGDNCQIFPNVVIGENVIIGNDVIIYQNVSLYDTVAIGNDCVIHAGAVIGSDGFGNAKDEHHHYQRIPQIGGVIIGNNVEIGANTTVDCGTFSPTCIADGVRIDNLVQIAHNCSIGAHTGIASKVGIAGNTQIGKHCMIAGNVGISDHISIADYTVIGGGSNVAKTITKAGLYSNGMSVMEYRDWAKVYIHLRNLEKTNAKIKSLQAQLSALSGVSAAAAE